MTINFNSPDGDVDGLSLSIHTHGDTMSIYEDRDTGVQKSVSDLLERHKALSLRATEIMEEGINYDSVLSVESIMPGLLTRTMPEGGFTFHTSKTNLTYSMEKISMGKVTLLTGAIALVCGLIYKFVKRIVDFFSRNGKDISNTIAKTQELSKSMSEKTKAITEKENSIRAELHTSSQRVAIGEWVMNDKEIRELLFRTCRLYKDATGIVLNPTNPADAINSLMALSNDQRTNSQGNILAKELPPIMFSDDIEGDLIAYHEYYNYIRLNIRTYRRKIDRLRALMIDCLNGTVNPLNNIDYSEYLEPLSKLMRKRYSSPENAIRDMRDQVKSDWLVPYRGPVTHTHVRNIIHVITETNTMNNLATLASDRTLETELMITIESNDWDLKNIDSPYQQAVADLQSNAYISDEDKAKRINLSEKFLVMVKDNLVLLNGIAETNTIFIGKYVSIVRSISRIVNRYYAFYDQYQTLLDAYEAKFK